MTAPTTNRATDATRILALGSIRITGITVAVLAATVALTFAIVTIVGPTVWVFSDDGTGAGTLTELPLGLRVARAVAFLLPCATASAMALLVAELAWKVRRGVRFVPQVSRAATALALTLGVGSWASKIAVNLVASSGLIYNDVTDPTQVDVNVLPIHWGFGAHILWPDPTLLGLAIVLGVLAYIIRAGERLQRDTDGLV